MHDVRPGQRIRVRQMIARREGAWSSEVIGEVLPHEHGPLLGACMRAEEHLRSWHPTLPFGRPIA